MKTIINILQPKLILLRTVFIIATLVGMISCGENEKPADTKEIAEESNEAKFDKEKAKDAEFLVKVAEINLEEIQLGGLAKESASMTDVKELGKMMVISHTKGQKELEALAVKKSITIPLSTTDKGKEAYEKLSNKTGIKFDKEYCDMMVSGHKKAIELFEKASTDANDPEIREWAAKTLPELNTHLEHSEKCKKLTEKM